MYNAGDAGRRHWVQRQRQPMIKIVRLLKGGPPAYRQKCTGTPSEVMGTGGLVTDAWYRMLSMGHWTKGL